MKCCPNCCSEKTTLFHDKVWSVDNASVFKCENCDLLFIDPMMSEEEERAFYANYNEHVKARGVIATESVDEFHAKSLPVAKERLKVVGHFFKAGQKVLEVGSSTGAFLSLIPHCQTNACELAEENRNYSEQFVQGRAYGALESVSGEMFDIICMYHVFEHIRDSKTFLAECMARLKPDGLIIIEVPCSDDPLITVFDLPEYKDFIFQPMHPMVYNEKSLDFVFHNAGLAKQQVIYHQRYGLSNHLAWLKNKCPGGDSLFNELFADIDAYSHKLEKLQKTDTIFYIARKAQ